MAFDFTFAWDGAGEGNGPGGPWDRLRVLHFEGHEEIGQLYRYELTLLAEHPEQEVDPADLVHRSATLRIHTLSTPGYRVVHGIVVEARELPASDAGQPYRVVLMPPLARAAYGKRCRIFLDKTLRQIVDAVLTGAPKLKKVDGATVHEDPGLPTYKPAAEQVTWRIADPSRVDDVRVRGYCVQYEESDLDFVSRLLEAEGIGYHVENGDGASLLVLADTDAGRPHLEPDAIGPGIPGRSVQDFRLATALRSDKVVLHAYNWKKPALDMTAQAGSGADLVDAQFPGGYPDSPAQGAPLAKARLERHATEAHEARGDGGIRVLSAGTVARLDHPEGKYDGEYLVTRLEVRGDAQGFAPIPGKALVPFYAWFTCARRGDGKSVAESRFRPARRTAWPRITGAQTALVTAEPGSSAEIDVGGPDGISIGCVRVQFHWDEDAARHAKEPTSCWVRVSDIFAGAGQGAVWHPRVGVEVIVTFEEGDPDRPLVSGRVYNGQNRPPYGGDPVHSTFKSFSTPGGGQWNEVTFDDSAGGELVYVHAGKDESIQVDAHRLEQIGSNATMIVGGNDTETIGASCSVTIAANESLTVGANQTSTIGANSTVNIDANSDKTVGASETYTIAGTQTIEVAAAVDETVTGAVSETYLSTLTTEITGAETQTIGGPRTTVVAAGVEQTYGSHDKTVDGFRLVGVMADQEQKVSGAVTQTYTGAFINLIGGEHKVECASTITRNTPFYLMLIGHSVETKAFEYSAKLFDLSLTGISLKAVGASAEATGVGIEVAGLKAEATLFKTHEREITIELIAATISMTSVYIVTSAIVLLI